MGHQQALGVDASGGNRKGHPTRRRSASDAESNAPSATETTWKPAHVCTCVRPTRPFYQRVVATWKRIHPFASSPIDTGALLDLEWFRHILLVGRLRSVPTSFFAHKPDPAYICTRTHQTLVCVSSIRPHKSSSVFASTPKSRKRSTWRSNVALPIRAFLSTLENNSASSTRC